jgi:DNA topoisomerase-1
VSREEVAQARELGVDAASGKPVSVRMGRFGPFVQMGTKDDEDKPRFAGLRPGQKMDSITFEQAMELFKLPRKLGKTAAGDEIVANVGRFGPYLKYGAKYASLKTDDPYEITPERALEVIREKEIADANRLILDFPDAGIQVLNGRYGPYITDKQRNAKIAKDKDPKSLTVEECQELLAAAPVRTFGKWGRQKGGPKAAQGKTANAPPARKTGKAEKTGAPKAQPARLAAKGSKAAVDKKSPEKIGDAPAKSKTKPAARTKPAANPDLKPAAKPAARKKSNAKRKP